MFRTRQKRTTNTDKTKQINFFPKKRCRSRHSNKQCTKLLDIFNCAFLSTKNAVEVRLDTPIVLRSNFIGWEDADRPKDLTGLKIVI